jgi:transcriptional regulator with XRE-family HTH domain
MNKKLRALRQRLGLTQGQMGRLFGSPLRTWQDWEYGKCQPPGPASLLIELADERPDVVEWLLGRAAGGWWAKRYAVFSWEAHEAGGGINDFVGWITVRDPLDKAETSAALRGMLEKAGRGWRRGNLEFSVCDLNLPKEVAEYEIEFGDNDDPVRVRLGYSYVPKEEQHRRMNEERVARGEPPMWDGKYR